MGILRKEKSTVGWCFMERKHVSAEDHAVENLQKGDQGPGKEAGENCARGYNPEAIGNSEEGIDVNPSGTVTTTEIPLD